MIQEHNIKSVQKIEYLLQFYNIILNKSILLKGGTMILIDKKLPATISTSYLHPSSRICTAVLNIMGIDLYLVNMYAPSGKNKVNEREHLFETDLMHQLIPNTDNIIMCGDWNCILSPKDTNRPDNACFSKALKRLMTTFKYKDIFLSNKRKSEFTFYRNNYAARLDRIYISKLFDNIGDTITYSASSSDHLCVCVSLELAPNIQVARPRWRLNVSLLEDTNRKENFHRIWSYIQDRKSNYPNLIQWWESLAKPQTKRFFINQGKEEKKLKQGQLKYLERNLRNLYEIANNDNIVDYEKIQQLRNEIDHHRNTLAKGLRIRSRIQDAIHGEKISSYLISKQKEISQKKIITKIIDDKGNTLNSYAAIKKYCVKFYKMLYSRHDCDEDKQAFFLSFLQNSLSDSDRNKLCSPITKFEIYNAAEDLALNKTPGIDGLPLEFYLENWEIISDDIEELYVAILQLGFLGESQRKGIITLIPKSNDDLSLSNFRPISQLCTDYKILAKYLLKELNVCYTK